MQTYKVPDEQLNIDTILSMNSVKDIKEEKPSIVTKFTNWIKRNISERVEKDETVPEKYRDRVPFSFRAIVSALATSVFLIILIYFTYIGYVSDQTTKYISLDSTIYSQDTSSPYRECIDVSNSLTGTWTLDKNGLWEGMSGFLGGYGFYKFRFFDFQESYPGYNSFMSEIKTAIHYRGTNATSQTAAQNLAYLMSWAHIVSKNGYDQRITFLGDPVYVFNRFYKSSSMGSTSFPCQAIPTIHLDKAAGLMTVQYSYGSATEYNSSTTKKCVSSGQGYISSANAINGCGGTGCCTSYDPSSLDKNSKTFDQSKCVIPPGDFGYESSFDADHFTLKYSVWSLITAYSVNMGILDYSSLEEVEVAAINNVIGCYSLNSNCSANALAGSPKCSSSTYGLAYESSNKRCSVTHPTSKAKYYMSARVDIRYPGMEAIICMIKEGETNPTVCLLRMGDAFVYPYFNHMGTSKVEDFYSWKNGCFCQTPDIPTQYKSFYDSTMYGTNSDGQYKGQYHGYCNNFDLIHGFIIFKSNHYEDHLLFNIVMASEYSASEIDLMAYYAGFMQLRLGGNAGKNPQTVSQGRTSSTSLLSKMMNTNSSSTNSLSFCTGLSGIPTKTDCSIFAMNTYDEFDTRINAEGAIAPFTSCVNSFELDDTAWDSGIYQDDDSVGPKSGDGAARLPPSSLIQKYYECYNTKQSSLLTAFGSASGSAGTIQPFIMTLFVLITVRIIMKKEKKGEKEIELNPRLKEIQLNINENSAENYWYKTTHI